MRVREESQGKEGRKEEGDGRRQREMGRRGGKGKTKSIG